MTIACDYFIVVFYDLINQNIMLAWAPLKMLALKSF